MLTTTSTGLSVSRKTGASSARVSASRSERYTRHAVAEDGEGTLERGDLTRERLVALGGALLAVETAFDRCEVGEDELELERVEVGDRVVVAGDVVVDERP